MPSESSLLSLVPPQPESVAKHRSSRERWVVWGIVALALVLRLLWLDWKPAHFDEGVNGFFVDQMTREGMYRYNPGDYHGPFHFYVLFIAQTLLGRSEWVLRLPLALAGAASVWVALLYRHYFGWRTAGLAALALAVSPGMTFYSRYAIHETWLLLGMLLAFWGAGGLLMAQGRGSSRALLATIGGITLMILNKETYLIHLVAFGLACGTLWLLPASTSPRLPPIPRSQQWDKTLLLQAIGGAVLLIIFFYSGTFLAPEGLPGIFTTFSKWIKTGTEASGGHTKPSSYWLKLMATYEWPALLGLIYSLGALLPSMNRLLRLMAIYGVGVLVAYSIVGYKTPWCIIAIVWPFLFLYGEAAKKFLIFMGEKTGLHALWAGLALLPLFYSGWESLRLNFRHPTLASEPYVYVQTFEDVRLLTTPLKRLAAEDPTTLTRLRGLVIMESYFPIPWLLGEYQNVGYYSDDTVPHEMNADFLLVSAQRLEEVERSLNEAYFSTSFHLRDGMASGRLYLKASTFRTVFPGRIPERSFAAQPLSPEDNETQ